MKKLLILSVACIAFSYAACSRFELPDFPAKTFVPDTTNTDSSYHDMPFPMGCAISVPLLKSNQLYRSLVAKEFTGITAENVMKMAALQPTQGNFSWDNADYLVQFADSNHQRVHGHTLIWHQSLPAFLQNYTGDSATLENIMKTHIQTVVTHFKGKVASWDVVNEVFMDDGTWRTSLWYQKLGRGFVERCFRYAHEADPNVKLFYNDYGHEYSAAKRTAIINLLNDMKSRGVPVHGIGLQMHTHVGFNSTNLAAAITTAAATGLLVHISELDISLNQNSQQNIVLTPAMLANQADRYKFVTTAYHAIPAAQQFGITTWNVTDADSWLRPQYNRPDWPLPFDDYYQRKPAFYAILQAVR